MAMSAALKEKRATLRKRLQSKTVSQLIPELEKAGVRGLSALNKKQLIEAVVALRVGPKTKSKQAKGSKHQYPGAGKGKDWHGEGPFRLMIIKGHNAGSPSIYADLGPYAAARGAIADAKTLLRQAAPVGKYELSNFHGRPIAEVTYEGVDGYIVRAGPKWEPADGDIPDLLAVIIQPTKKGGVLDKEAIYGPDVIGGRRLTKRKSMKLNNGRRNKNVSFTTRSGEKVSFKTKKNSGRRNASASSLTTAQHAALNSLQYQDSLQDFNPTTVESLLRRGLIKKGPRNTYSLTAAGKKAPKGGGRIVSQDIYSNPRTNHHLVKGEHVKWSQQGVLNVGWAGPHDRGRVMQVTKSGYVVDWGSGTPMPVPDKWLVDARSGSDYFPGSDYEGKTPGRGNPSRSASLQYEHVLREAYGEGSLQYYLALKRALDAGEVSGGSIVGSGYKSHKVKKLAHHWIDEQIRKLGPHENPDRWVRGVVKEMEEHGTVGAFTKQARAAGYKNTMEFARKVMEGWRSGAKKVYNKKTRRRQTITMKTMRRANFALNV